MTMAMLRKKAAEVLSSRVSRMRGEEAANITISLTARPKAAWPHVDVPRFFDATAVSLQEGCTALLKPRSSGWFPVWVHQ